MTNEEIEKKFEFDLAMGVFKRSEPEMNDYIFRTKLNVFLRSSEMLRLATLLEKIGYKNSYNQDIRIRNIKAILIFPDKKAFITSIRDYETLPVNDIPEYINDYIIE